MSTTRRSNKKKSKKELPKNALHYCPQYIAWDKEVREETKTRFRDHYTERRKVLIECIDATLDEIRDPELRLQFNDPPVYDDNDTIIQAAFKQIDTRINEWGGVQFSPQFIRTFNRTRTPMNKKTFIKGAKNHQDQTSWRVAGNHFFAPYLAEAKGFFHRFCKCILDISEDERNEIYKFTCIAYIVILLTTEIKFHRTKGKSLIRQKTMVKSTGIHIEIERLYPALKVRSFIAAAKRKRKQEQGRTTIISEDFHKDLLDCCHTLYRDQKQKVYQICGVSMEIETSEGTVRDLYPEELMDSETDVDRDRYEPYESPSSFSNTSSPSTPVTVTRTVSNRSSNHNRNFQSVNPRNYSVRDAMNRDRNRERREHREAAIRRMHEDVSHRNGDINDPVLINESVPLSPLDNDHGYIASRQPDASYPNYLNSNNTDVQLQIQREFIENQRLLREVVAMREAILGMDRYAPPYSYAHTQEQTVQMPPPIRRRSSNPYFVDFDRGVNGMRAMDIPDPVSFHPGTDLYGRSETNQL